MKKIIDKLILVFLFIQPFLDVITSIQIRYNFLSIYISSIIRVLFMLFILIYMIVYKYDFKLIILLFIYGIIELVHLYFNDLLYIFNVIKIFYLPVLIMFFSKYELKISKRSILIIYACYLLLLLIPTVFGFGFDIYASNDNKKGFIGLFYGGNELSGILLGLLPIILIYLKDVKNIILRVLYYIVIAISFVILSTKTVLVGGIIVVLIYLYNSINKKKIFVISTISIVALLFLILPFTPVVNNLKVALDYYGINNTQEMFSFYAIDNVIFSRRLTYAKNLFSEYESTSVVNKLFGMTRIIKDAELDLVDIFITIGLIGFIIYIFIMTYLLRKNRLKNEYKISLILFIIMSCFSGHILIKPAVAIYMALLFNLGKEDNHGTHSFNYNHKKRK